MNNGRRTDRAELIDNGSGAPPCGIDRLAAVNAEQIVSASAPVPGVSEREAELVLAATAEPAVAPDSRKVALDLFSVALREKVTKTFKEFRAMRVSIAVQYAQTSRSDLAWVGLPARVKRDYVSPLSYFFQRARYLFEPGFCPNVIGVFRALKIAAMVREIRANRARNPCDMIEPYRCTHDLAAIFPFASLSCLANSGSSAPRSSCDCGSLVRSETTVSRSAVSSATQLVAACRIAQGGTRRTPCGHALEG